MARQRSGGLIGDESLQKSYIPGAESVMSSYEKIMGERGINREKEIEDNARKSFDKWSEGQRRSGKPVNAMEWDKYTSKQTAYQLDQGPNGAAAAKQRGEGYNKYLAMM